MMNKEADNKIVSYSYVTDPDNNRILYASQETKTVWGADIEGKYCYEVFQRGNEACPTCPHRELKDDDTQYHQEIYIPALNNYMLVRSERVQWTKDKEGFFHLGVDLTKSIESRKQLEQKLKFEQWNRSISELFIKFESEEAIKKSLKLIGEYTKADCSFLTIVNKTQDQLMLSYIWRKEEGMDILPLPMNVDISTFSFWPKRLEQQSIIHVDVTQHLESVNEYERQLIEQLSIKKVILVAIYKFGELHGYVGLYGTEGQVWGDAQVQLITNFANLLSAMAEKNELEEKKRELQEYERIREAFFSNLSHEFRTPLNLINTSVQVLKEFKSSDPQEFVDHYLKYEDEICTNSYRVLRLMNNMLDLTKMHSDCFEMNTMVFNVVEVVEEVVVHVRKYIEEKKEITIIFDTKQEEIAINGSIEEIERIMLNLLANAVKFSRASNTIWVTIERKDQWAVIVVEDEGISIPKAYRESIFQQFVQVDKSITREKEGCGIGLSITKALVEYHGGEIFLDESYTSGCRFVIKLPIVVGFTSIDTVLPMIADERRIKEKIKLEFSDIYDLS